jgi:hypothetical protein
MKHPAYACVSTRTDQTRSFSYIVLTAANASSDLGSRSDGRLPAVWPRPRLEVPGRGHEPETRSDSSGYLVRLSNDARAAREFVHTVGDTRSQLEHRLAQFAVFCEVALNSTEIDL